MIIKGICGFVWTAAVHLCHFFFSPILSWHIFVFSVLLLLLCGQKCGKKGIRPRVGVVESSAMAFVLIEMFLLLRWLLCGSKLQLLLSSKPIRSSS